MEGVSYVDIYATKGIEYLIVIAFLLFFVFFCRYLRRPVTAAPARGGIAAEGGRFRVPEGFHFHRGHSWLRLAEDGTGSVGIDDFARKLVGRVDAVDLPRVGTRLSQGEKGWSLVVDGETIPMLSPANGEVVAVNPDVVRLPDILRLDPYERGWLLKVRSPRLAANARNLLSGSLARRWMEDTLEGLRPPPPADVGPVLPDGGLPVEGLARIIGGEAWSDLARKHFLTDGE
jgi:glycine cleavage system H protein